MKRLLSMLIACACFTLLIVPCAMAQLPSCNQFTVSDDTVPATGYCWGQAFTYDKHYCTLKEYPFNYPPYATGCAEGARQVLCGYYWGEALYTWIADAYMLWYPDSCELVSESMKPEEELIRNALFNDPPELKASRAPTDEQELFPEATN